MSDIITVAQGTFERFAKLKALYAILVICILDVAAMGLYKDLTMGLDKELMLDCSLAIATAVGLITAMVAAFDIPRELREKTAMLILSKPGGRGAFVWGKFCGISALAVFNIAIVVAGSYIVMLLKYDDVDPMMMGAAALVAAEAVCLVGAGILFSMFLADTMAAIAVFLVFAVGHMTFMLARWIGGAGKAIYYVLPSFWNTDIKLEVSNGIEVPGAFVGFGILHALLWGLAFTGLGMVIFSRKDIS